MTAPCDRRRFGAPDPDPVTGRAPLAPTAAADDVPALLAEADAFCAGWERATLRLALVADQSLVIRRLLAERDEARRDRDRLARRLRAVGAIAHGARFRLDPDPESEADAGDAPP